MIALVLALQLLTVVASDPTVPPRSGSRLAAELGVGYIAPFQCARRCDRFQGPGPALSLYAGSSLRPDFALVGGSGVTFMSFADRSTGGLVDVRVAAQYWVADRLWLRGGFGAGMLFVSRQDNADTRVTEWSANGLTAGGAAGLEITARGLGRSSLHVEVGELWFRGRDIATHNITVMLGGSYN